MLLIADFDLGNDLLAAMKIARTLYRLNSHKQQHIFMGNYGDLDRISGECSCVKFLPKQLISSVSIKINNG